MGRRAQKKADTIIEDVAVTPSFDIERVETGVVALDAVLMGGLPYGSVVVLGGREDAGKTNFALNIVANAVKSGYRAIYVDVENRLIYNPSRFQYKRLSADEIKRIEIFPGENAVETVAAHIRARLAADLDPPVRVVVIDSLASLHTRSFRLLRESMSDGGVGIGAVARAITDEMKDLFTYYAVAKKVLFVITTQLRVTIQGQPHTELYGARYIKHAAATIIRITPIGKLQLSFDDPIPQEVTVGGVKRPVYQFIQFTLDKCQLTPYGIKAGIISRMFLINSTQRGIYVGDYDNLFQLLLYGRRRPLGFIEKRGQEYVITPTGTTFTLRDAYMDEALRNRIIEECKPFLYEMMQKLAEDAFNKKMGAADAISDADSDVDSVVDDGSDDASDEL